MPVFTDQLERKVDLELPPRRIVSLVPSQTELLFDLGLDEEVVGITKFCVHPENWFRTKTKIGGTKHLRQDVIRLLKPDLIIANKEENVKEQIAQLSQEFPVWVSDVNNLQDALQMIKAIGEITNTKERADIMSDQIQVDFLQLPALRPKLQTAYLIWKDPYMTAGGDTFINDMLNRSGFVNRFASQTRYPEIQISDLYSCELVLLSSEPYPFRQKHVEELQEQLPSTKIILVDGEPFSWYGSRLLKAPAYFQQLQIQALSLF